MEHSEFNESAFYMGDILGRLFERWPTVLIVTGLSTLAAVVYVFLATPWYRAEVQVLPRDDRPGSGLSSQLAQLGGLAGLAGLNLSSSGKEEPIAVLRSAGFSRQFIQQNNLTSLLLSGSGAFGLRKWISREGEEPDIRDAVRVFQKKVLTISEDRKLGLVTIAVEWTDPSIAALWANMFVDQLNKELRSRALAEAEGNVTYLHDEIRKTDLIALQQAIGRLLESELQKLMVARGKTEFAFRIIDRAEVPKKPSRPQRFLIVLAGFSVGFLVSMVMVVVISSARHSRAG